MCKDTCFSLNATINCRGRLIDLKTPRIMGILNITEDSFYDGGSYLSERQIMNRALQLWEEGASFVDIGAVSTRPGAMLLPLDEEMDRLVPVVRQLRKQFPDILISVDTCWSEVAKAMADAGADMINDISGGQYDTYMFKVIAQLGLPYVLMHTSAMPSEMQNRTNYGDLIQDLTLYFAEKVNQLRELGVKDILIDPGFGFGKTLEQNYELLARLHEFSYFELPILVGLSRKSMIYKLLDADPSAALTGTIALHAAALMKGAAVLRVHDVKEAVETLKVIRPLCSAQ